jgi:hypothetical protein
VAAERLNLLGAVGRDDVWGLQFPPGDATEPLQLTHWDGTTWSPDPEDPGWIWKATTTGPQVWVSGGQGFAQLGRLEMGEWTYFQAPEEVNDFAAVAPDDIWLIGASKVWRGDGTSWTEMAKSPGPLPPFPPFGWAEPTYLVTAGPDAIWLRSKFFSQHWDGKSFQSEDPSSFCPDQLSLAPDGTMIAAGVDSLPAGIYDESTPVRTIRRRQGEGWSEPLAAPPQLGLIFALWARTADDIWLWANSGPDSLTNMYHGHVVHLKNGSFTEFSLHDAASVSLIWGDEQGTYLGTSSGAIWAVPFPD